MDDKKDLLLYVHIPFCIRKCRYCDFASGPASKEEIARYFDNLLFEIEGARSLRPERGYLARTVFIGGGTPTSVEAVLIQKVMDKLREVFCFAPEKEMEITIEANPGTLTMESLRRYRSAGINRLSIGLQSADQEELKNLGRIHSYEDFLRSFQMAREAGFQNINIDLMSALPGQDTASWEKTLYKARSLSPEHISAYSLILEEGTPFYDQYRGREDLLPSEEEERRMYRRTKEILNDYGYERYEISNYAKKGYACRHNLGYWERKPYLGFGLSAASLFREVRTQNPSTQQEYEKLLYKNGERETEILSEKEQMEEFMFLGLRKIEGISKEAFYQAFQRPIQEIYQPAIDKLKAAGLIEETKDRVYLTEYGLDVSNQVFVEFLL